MRNIIFSMPDYVKGIKLLSVVIVLAVLMMGAANSYAGATQHAHHDPQTPQAGSHGFIGLPVANDIAVQNISSATVPITVSFINSSYLITSVESLSPGLAVVIQKPDVELDPFDSWYATIEAPTDAQGQLPIAGVNFELPQDQGAGYVAGYSDSYTGLKLIVPAASTFSEMAAASAPTFFPLVLQVQEWSTGATFVNNATSTANIVVSFYDKSGTLAGSTSDTLSSGGRKTYSPLSGGLSGFDGSVVISSDQSLTQAKTFLLAGGSLMSYGEIKASQVSKVLIAPALFKGKDLQTSQVCVQNTASRAATVKMAYSDGLNVIASLGPSGNTCFKQSDEAHMFGWSGGAVISSTESVAAVVAVSAFDGSKLIGGWLYIAPSQESLASKSVAMPILLRNYHKVNSEVVIFNPADVPAIVTPRYTANRGQDVLCPPSFTVPPKGQVTLSQAGLPPFMRTLSGYLSSTQPIAVAVNMKSSKPLGTIDRHLGYAAVNAQPITLQAACNHFYVNVPVVNR